MFIQGTLKVALRQKMKNMRRRPKERLRIAPQDIESPDEDSSDVGDTAPPSKRRKVKTEDTSEEEDLDDEAYEILLEKIAEESKKNRTTKVCSIEN